MSQRNQKMCFARLNWLFHNKDSDLTFQPLAHNFDTDSCFLPFIVCIVKVSSVSCDTDNPISPDSPSRSSEAPRV